MTDIGPIVMVEFIIGQIYYIVENKSNRENQRNKRAIFILIGPRQIESQRKPINNCGEDIHFVDAVPFEFVEVFSPTIAISEGEPEKYSNIEKQRKQHN